jgi:putative intracellular protease/amidase
VTLAYLIAGAGRATSSRSVRYHRDCLAAIGTARPTIAYVGAAADDDPAFATRISSLVFGDGARVVRVPLTRRALQTSVVRARLADADLVFFTGGDVERGMALVDERGLAPYVRELAAAGKPMEGISAGAILLGRSWVRFPTRGAPTRFACLGVVPASFDTHGEDDGWSELRELARRARGERVVFGIPSHGAASWDGHTLRALGDPLACFTCGSSPRERRAVHAARLVGGGAPV